MPVTHAGVSFTQINVGTGASRCDAFTSFVAPVLHRKNLVVASGAHVRRVVLRPCSAQGEERFEVTGVEMGSLSWTRQLARFRINDRDELKAAEVPAPSPTIESAQTADTEYHHVPTVGRHLQVYPALGFTSQVAPEHVPEVSSRRAESTNTSVVCSTRMERTVGTARTSTDDLPAAADRAVVPQQHFLGATGQPFSRCSQPCRRLSPPDALVLCCKVSPAPGCFWSSRKCLAGCSGRLLRGRPAH